MDDPWLFVNNSVVLFALYLTDLLATAFATLESGFSTQKYSLIYNCRVGFHGFIILFCILFQTYLVHFTSFWKTWSTYSLCWWRSTLTKFLSRRNFIIIYVQYFEYAHKIVFTSNVFLLDLVNCTVLHKMHSCIEAWGVALLCWDQTLNVISIALVSTSAL